MERARTQGKPYFIEAMAYRFRGHSMADPAEYRTKVEEERWRMRDPLLVFRNQLLEDGQAYGEELDALNSEVEAEVEEAIKFADESPFPEPDALFEDIYAE